MDEISIVKGSQRRDMEMFKLLVKKHSPKAIRTAYLIIGQKQLAKMLYKKRLFNVIENTQRQELGKNLIKAAGFYFAMANTSSMVFLPDKELYSCFSNNNIPSFWNGKRFKCYT